MTTAPLPAWPVVAPMRRVMIVGQPGSGKSTLARRLGTVTGLPVIHIDRIHWRSGWVERPREEKTRLCRDVHARDRWIFEGGHSVTWPERLERSDTLIWLDVPLATRLRRVVGRTLLHHGRTRPDLPDGCPERFDWRFYWWIWSTRTSARRQIRRLIDRADASKSVVILRQPSDVDAFVVSLDRGSES